MKRLALAFMAVMMMVACPDPLTGKIDPYMTARTVINQAGVSLALADGIFNQWLLAQSDVEKAKKTQATYVQIKTAVANGLQVAYVGVGIAEQAKKDPDISKLLAEADNAWKALSKLLGGLLGAGDSEVTVALATAPASQPATGSKAPLAKINPMDYLPKSLIPGGE